jgi:hypothetical protein
MIIDDLSGGLILLGIWILIGAFGLYMLKH